MSTITTHLSDSQVKMVHRLMEHYGSLWSKVSPPISPPTDDAEILQICLHVEHARIFGEDEHQRVMSGDE